MAIVHANIEPRQLVGPFNALLCFWLRHYPEKSAMKVAFDFVSPENVRECIRLSEGSHLLSPNHRFKEDKLELCPAQTGMSCSGGGMPQDQIIQRGQESCVDSGINCVDKPIFLKPFENLWENLQEKEETRNRVYPSYEEFVKNTLLIDDFPYKALRNPDNTAIFPEPYSYTNHDDNFLEKGGVLQSYQEKLVDADSVP
ncbi:hypothetical protein ACFE04_021274 [Oxalis oulophora]